jgi:hypothetical protein
MQPPSLEGLHQGTFTGQVQIQILFVWCIKNENSTSGYPNESCIFGNQPSTGGYSGLEQSKKSTIILSLPNPVL